MSRRSVPWITADIKKLCEDILYKCARRLCSAKLLMDYRAKRRELKVLLSSSRQAYLRSELASTNDSGRIWHILRKEGLTVDKNNLSCNSFTAQELNSFSTLCFHEITAADVYETARMLSSKSKGQNPDGLPWKYFENLLLSLLPFLVKIFNCSISTNNYPDLSKRAFIIPLNKCNNPQSVSDTRPIANLCYLAKVFHKIIATHISQHLETNSLLSPFQFGFRSEHNIQSALLYFTDRIRYDIEKNLVTLATLFDFRRAFDSIDHEALLRECRNMKFSPDAIKWVHSYISGRTQAVICQDEQSDSLPVTSGVPQGSSPGPIFYSILINSLPRCLKYCKFSYILFADDQQLFMQCPVNLISSAVTHMTEEANNPGKIKSIIFGSASNLSFLATKQLPSVVVDNHPVQYVSQTKNLGVL